MPGLVRQDKSTHYQYIYPSSRVSPKCACEAAAETAKGVLGQQQWQLINLWPSTGRCDFFPESLGQIHTNRGRLRLAETGFCLMSDND